MLQETPIVQMFKGNNLCKILDNFADECTRRKLKIDILGKEGHEVYIAFKNGEYDEEYMGKFDIDAQEGYLLDEGMMTRPEGITLH